jgi:hypothetical protein
VDSQALLVTFTPEEKFQWETRAVERYWSGVTPEVSAAEESGTKWAQHFFPNLFSRPFTKYQEEFWDWGWGIEPDVKYRPRVECQPRGVGKSTNAEALVVSMVARKKRKMIGYVSLNEQKATKHFESIKSMLESDKFQEAYPHCAPKVQKLKDITQQWSREAIVMDSGAMIVPLTLLGSSRGWKSSEGVRFDVIVLDDIDELGQSVEYTRKLIELLKGEILAAGYDKTLVIVPQNLIYRDSIVSQIYDQRADILSDRDFRGPYPLLKWYEAEKVPIEGDTTGAKRWVITAGEPFDPAIDIAYAESLLDTFGKVLFDRECQQLVFEIEDDKDFREWSEIHHLITKSEFRRVMEAQGEPVWNEQRNRLQIPMRCNVGLGFDWGTTKRHPSSVAFVARFSSMTPFSDCHFVFAEVIRPKFPLDAFETPEIVSPGRVATAVQDKLKEWNVLDSQVKMKLLSHEASAALNTMAVDLKDDVKMFWNKWQAKKGSGVPQIQNLLEIDYTKPHPFRTYPENHPKAGMPLMGRPRLYFIVEDEQGSLWSNGIDLYVTGAQDADGFARARFEIPLYSHKNATGDKKIDDDFVDAFRGLMNRFGVRADSKTRDEIVEEALESKGLAMTEIEQIEDERDKLARLQVRLIEQAAMKKPQNKYPRVAVKWR